ncbi:hypothetical protein BH11MYX1_BH11MYX1_00900 [soil metagenome]
MTTFLRGAALLARTTLVLVVASCGDNQARPDSTAASTSVDGSIGCGALTCTADQLCVSFQPGVPGGGGPTLACKDVPASCVVADCSGSACPSCIAEICQGPPPTLGGRNLSCDAI